MEQFKWQHPETAAGYFRVDPDGVAKGQRELYDEVAVFYQDIVVDSLVDEYQVWERRTIADTASLPAGPDGRRKRDVFKAVREALEREPRVEEDDRRLRLLLRHHAQSIRLTEYGWCDYDPAYALCGSDGAGPITARCEPNRCLNHATTSAALPAHQVKYDRLIALSRDRSMPSAAREQARQNADRIRADLGEHIRSRP